MKLYDKNALILEYLTIIQEQDRKLEVLRRDNISLSTRVRNLKRSSKNYRDQAILWKTAYKDLKEDFTATNSLVQDLMNNPISKIEKVIKAYKENM